MKKLLLSLALLLVPTLLQAQITSLQGTTDSLTMVLAGAKTSVDATYIVSWEGAGGPKSEVGTTNGVTAVTPVTGVASGKNITSIVVNNADTGSITLTINKKSGSTSYPITVATLAVGDTFVINRNLDMRVVDSKGQLKYIQTSNLLTLSVGASTAGAGTTTTDAGLLPAGTAQVYPTTLADDTVGVRISATDTVLGRTLFIGNGVSNKILKIYPPTGGTINGGSANAAFSTASGHGGIVTCINASTNAWVGF